MKEKEIKFPSRKTKKWKSSEKQLFFMAMFY